MVYGVGNTAPRAAAPPGLWPGACGGCSIHSAQPAESAATALPDPWESAQDPWAQGCPPCAPEAQHPSLDPFGKGKGKGKPFQCYNCLGFDHPARLCASPYGAGESKQGSPCSVCKGYGHAAPMCTSKGGEKCVGPPPGKGKGKDKSKGKGKGFQSAWGPRAHGKGKGKVSAFDDWPGSSGGWA